MARNPSSLESWSHSSRPRQRPPVIQNVHPPSPPSRYPSLELSAEHSRARSSTVSHPKTPSDTYHHLSPRLSSSYQVQPSHYLEHRMDPQDPSYDVPQSRNPSIFSENTSGGDESTSKRKRREGSEATPDVRQELRRQRHQESEKKRRSKINDAIEEARNVLPGYKDQMWATAKADVINDCVRYIIALEQTLSSNGSPLPPFAPTGPHISAPIRTYIKPSQFEWGSPCPSCRRPTVTSSSSSEKRIEGTNSSPSVIRDGSVSASTTAVYGTQQQTTSPEVYTAGASSSMRLPRIKPSWEIDEDRYYRQQQHGARMSSTASSYRERHGSLSHVQAVSSRRPAPPSPSPSTSTPQE